MRICKAAFSQAGGRQENEDRFSCELSQGRRGYAVVADGLGGHGDGALAAEIVVAHFSRCGGCEDLPTPSQIEDWFQAANAEIQSRRTSQNRMKSTVVFLALFQDKAIWAHAGDSRLYHFCNGVLQDVTYDHSVPQVEVLLGELTREQIPLSPDRNKLLQAVGSEDLQPEIHIPMPLQPGRHAFLLCSDGCWEYLSDEEIALDLVRADTPEMWLRNLRRRMESRQSDDADNCTAVALYAEV